MEERSAMEHGEPGGESLLEVGAGIQAEQVGSGAAEPSLVGTGASEVRAGGAGEVRAWLRDLVISVAVSAFIILFLYQPVRVEGTSMLPELEDQDRLFVSKVAYQFGPFETGKIERGDVVVFLYPRDHTKSYIKRVIALPGDQLRIDHGRVLVNGQAVAEPYVPARFADERSHPFEVIAADHYFLMGDHRSISSDSREFGPVERSLIYGKAAFVYWPVDQVGVVR